MNKHNNLESQKSHPGSGWLFKQQKGLNFFISSISSPDISKQPFDRQLPSAWGNDAVIWILQKLRQLVLILFAAHSDGCSWICLTRQTWRNKYLTWDWNLLMDEFHNYKRWYPLLKVLHHYHIGNTSNIDIVSIPFKRSSAHLYIKQQNIAHHSESNAFRESFKDMCRNPWKTINMIETFKDQHTQISIRFSFEDDPRFMII